MRVPYWDLRAQYTECKDDIDTGISNIIDQSDFLGGTTNSNLEANLIRYTGSPDVATVSSGTAALLLTYHLLDLHPGDEVITPSLTFGAGVESIVQAGGKPVFVDVDEYYHIDADKIEDAITDKTKALSYVSLYGQTPNVDKLRTIAEKHNLCLIEDGAHAFGTTWNGKKVGTLADITCFSFNIQKTLSAFGDSGAVCGFHDVCENIRSLRVHGRTGIAGEFDEVGYNARMSNINAVVLSAKLKKIDEWIDSKREVCKIYDEELAGIVKTPLQRPGSYHTYYVYGIECPDNTRNNLVDFLKKNEIQTRISWPLGVHETQAYGVYCLDRLPKTEHVTKNVLSLPCYHTIREQDYVIKKIKEFYG
tara:strand:- start:68925 stop:70013 length:1089 start_codon:yes stop_codon:yes gene_type:complete